MEKSEAVSTDGREQAQAVGKMLAEAFIARVERYPSQARRQLLVACRQTLLQNDEIAKILFDGE